MSYRFAEEFLKRIRLEHWLRFYFIAEKEKPMQASSEELHNEEQNLVFHVPQHILNQTLSEYPMYGDLLYNLINSPVSLENSRDAVFSSLGNQLGLLPSSSEFEDKMKEIVSDDQFRRDMDFFHSWVQALANGEIDIKGNALPKGASPDETLPSFSEWDNAFLFWYSLQNSARLKTVLT